MTDAQIAILLKARDEASKVMDNLATRAKKLGSTMGTALKVGGIAAGVGIGAAAFALVGFAKAAAEEQVGIVKLQTAIGTLDEAHRGNADEVEKLVKTREKLAFADDEIRDSLAALIPATGDYDEAVRRQAIAMDLARGTGLDLATASRLVGKVNEETTEVLKRYGITLGEGMTQTEALAAIQERFAGQSAAHAETAQAKWTVFNNTLDNLKETIGGALLPVAGLLGEALASGLEKASPHIEAAVGHFQTLADFFSGALTGNVEAAAAAFAKLPEPLQDIVLWLVENDIKGKLEAAADVIGGVLTSALQGWHDILVDLWPLLQDLGQWLIDNQPVLVGLAIAIVGVLLLLGGWPAIVIGAAIAAGVLRDKVDELKESNENLATVLDALGKLVGPISVLIDQLAQESMREWNAVLWGLAYVINEFNVHWFTDFQREIGIVKGAVDIAKDTFYFFKDAVYSVRDAFYALRDAIRSLPSLPDFPSLPGAGGFSFPGLAGGGVAEGWTMVGERGRELVYAGSPARVYSNEDTEQMLAGGRYAGANITINVYDAGDPLATAREIDRQMRA